MVKRAVAAQLSRSNSGGRILDCELLDAAPRNFARGVSA
jgi:hypothetical protein